MSLVKTELGQKLLLPTENQNFDNNAELDNSSNTSSGEEQVNIEIIKGGKKYSKIYKSLFKKMLNFLKEFFFMILVACIYAALTNDPPKVSKSPAAYPFFSKESIITDWYRGQISLAIEQARKSDIAFVMFYAPWDAKSQDIRLEFELTGKYMQNLISFTAINCWQPDSECHQQYRKVYNWPVLIAYPTHGRGIQYNGAKTSEHMIKFLTGIINPLIRIDEFSEIYSLLAVYDAVILAELNASPGSLDYAVFYSIALRFLEKDPYREIAFAVITNSNVTPTLKICMWNETLIYPTEKEWRTEALLSWVYKYLHQITMWVSPMGTKSHQLSSYIQSNPALILFTPRNSLMPFVDYYDLFKDTALSYHNCKNSPWINGIQATLKKTRQENLVNYKNLLHKCVKKREIPKYPPVISISKVWPNNTCTQLGNNECVQNNLKKASELCRNLQTSHLICNTFDSTCNSELLKTSMLTACDDSKSMNNLRQVHDKNECNLFQLTNNLNKPIFEKADDGMDLINITGLGCMPNSTLTFVAMDSLKYHHFAERLGVDLQEKQSAVILINDQMEMHHVLREITLKNLKEFIHNFTINQLSRAFFNSNTKFKKTHVYTEVKNCNRKADDSNFCVDELNSKTFLPTVMQNNKAVIIFYHSKQCSFCNGISYIFLNVAKLFRAMDNVVFARIDGELNTLPWEYTMDVFPTILYFPPQRKSESRVFPVNMQLNTSNLLNFILINMESSMKLHAMWIICENVKFEIDKKSCITSIRVEILSLINKNLKLWRNGNSRERAELLYKLQQLRTLHLFFAHSPDNVDSIVNYLKKLSSISISSATNKIHLQHVEL